jgi:hypothetical protein
MTMTEAAHLYFAIHRGEKWVTKRVEDATEDDFRGINMERDFMSAATMSDSLDAALVQIETNLGAGNGPFDAIHDHDQHGRGIDLIKRLIREAGHRVSRL